MLKKLICFAIIILVLSVPLAIAKSIGSTQTVVLLPIEQTDIPANSRLSDGHLSNSVVTQLSRLKGFELVGFAELSKAYDKHLVDEAVFELLVTDDLKHILAKLDALEKKAAKLIEYCKISKDTGIDYLVDTSVQQDSTKLRITYTVISTATNRIVSAKTFYDVPNDPIGVSDEIAKRLVRSLWKLENI